MSRFSKIKGLIVLSALVSQSALAETIVCTGALIVNNTVAGVPKDHTPIEIDRAPTQSEENYMGHPVVIANANYKVTAKRSVNATADVVLELWKSGVRTQWAAGMGHVMLGFQNGHAESTYANLNCYTSDTWKEMNARLCPDHTEIPAQLKTYCDSLNENRDRNF